MTTRVRTFALGLGGAEIGNWHPGRLKVIAQGDDDATAAAAASQFLMLHQRNAHFSLN